MDADILKYVSTVDEVWHAGDIGDLRVIDAIKKLRPIRSVYGNIDDAKARAEFPMNLRFKCEEVSVFITHIGGYPGKYSANSKKELTINVPKLFITGHSHILKVMQDKQYNLLFMNPGAIGTYGFHKARTMLRFEIDRDKIQNLEVIEFKR